MLADTEQIWADIFKEEGKTYVSATLVMFTDAVQSDCGIAAQSLDHFIVQQTRSSILI